VLAANRSSQLPHFQYRLRSGSVKTGKLLSL
jgi:hypothetical protein